MKKILLSFLLLFSIVSLSQNLNSSLGFIENKGQIIDQNGKINNAVKYLLNTNGLNVQLRQNGFSYDVYETKKVFSNDNTLEIKNCLSQKLKVQENYTYTRKYHRIDINFLGCNINSTLIPLDKSVDYYNYYNVNSAPSGILNVYHYKKIMYKNIYPNIDVIFFIPNDKSKPVEYNFIINPGGKISDIQLEFNGARTELIDNKIRISVRFGAMDESLPLSWTEIDQKTKLIDIKYKKIKKNVFTFSCNDLNSINKNAIIIDPVPVRLWGTYYGGSGYDTAGSIDIDINNNVYIGGGTGSSTNIATAGSYQSNYNNAESFIAKLDPDGNRIWGSYYPFRAANFKLDPLGNIFLYGEVLNSNPNIPSIGCYQSVKNNYYDTFLIKLDNSGFKLWGTYYGGNNNESLNSICFDSSNNIYITGETNSTGNTFASNGCHQSNNNSNPNFQDAFVSKFDTNGNRIWSTYYGGLGSDSFFNIFIADDGFLYTVGTQNSTTNIATSGAYQTVSNADSGGMIVKFDTNGQRIWGTYICDSSYVMISNIRGNYLYLTGRTWNQNTIATTGTYVDTYQPVPSSSQVTGIENTFVVKFNIQTQQKEWGTYFFELIRAIDTNNNHEIYFSGDTNITSDIATPDAYMPTKNFYYKCYLIKLNNTGQKIWGTYYGGNMAEQLGYVKIDNSNNIYLYGNTNGSTTGIATNNAHQTTLGSNPDTYLVKFLDCLSVSNANSNSPICIGENLNLNAFGGTNYNWIGPNGFISNQQNPIITNANNLNSGQYTCTITGTNGCDNSVTIDVAVGDLTKPIPNVSSLPTISGDCTSIIPVPTATDNCSGIINGTTTNPTNYPLPGTYNFVWTYTDANGNIETQNQTVIISPVALPTVNSPQTFCIQQNATLNDITITGQNIQWYDAQTGGNLLTPTSLLQNSVTYYASQTSNGCESSRIPVTINLQNTVAPTGNSSQSFCALQNPTLNDLTIIGTNINFYNSSTGTTILAANTLLVDGDTYYATQTNNGCESVNRLPITVNLIFSLNANNYSTSICDEGNDGTELVDLSQFDSNLLNSSGNTFTYYKSFNGAENQIVGEQFNANHTINLGLNTIFVRIDSSNGCHQIVTLQLNLVPVPVLAITDEVFLCEGSNITVNAGTGFNSYSWSTGAISSTISINQAGNYSVTVTKNYGSVICSSTKNFTVTLSNAPTITSIDTIDWTDTENSITVYANGLGDYEYSIDGINFQNSNIFNGLPNGNYTVTVRDKKECGEDTEQVYLLNYPKFFTPNGDGNNDGWRIKFSQFEPNFEVRIFDRYGKLLRIMKNNEAWDGNYNGRQLPSDDYWFYVVRNDGRIHKGHFAMLR